MSTVLTNGVIIPENGSRNWGGDLANNWNILDVHVGYVTDVKNRVTTLENSVTTLENSVAENTANIQINASNISALQTSKQDKLSDQQIANIADVTNKAIDNDVVHKSGDETISGVKNFSSNGCTFFKQIRINHNLEYGKDNPPSQATYHNLMFTGANGWWGSYIENVTDINGNSILAFYVRNTNEVNSRVYLKCDISGSFSMYPFSNNAWDLGTSTNKWKTLNGVNPGALSLPNPSPSVFISKSLPSSGGTITADVDGWLEIRTKATSPNALIQLFIAGGSSIYAKNTGDTLIISVPMRVGISVTIFYKDIETPTVCRLVPCVGNV